MHSSLVEFIGSINSLLSIHFFNNKIKFIRNFSNDFQKNYGKRISIINHIIKFCDHFSLFQANLKNELQENRLKVLNLERDYSRSNRGQLSTRIEAFMEMI